MAKGKRQYKLSLLQEMHSELTAATLKSLTRVLCHEDYKVLRRHFRQVLVESWTVALGSVCVSLFCAPFSSFLFSLLLRYCLSYPAMTSRSPKHKWRWMSKRPTLPQKTPFSALILFSRYANWFTYKEYHETATYLTHLACLNMQKSGLTNHTTEPIGRSCWAIKINPYFPLPSTFVRLLRPCDSRTYKWYWALILLRASGFISWN